VVRIKPGVELELKGYVEDLQREDIQKSVAQEILSDERFWIEKGKSTT
jgi:hypothetical protein